MEKITPAKAAKKLGCVSLREASDAVGLPYPTLSVWHKTRPKIFDACCEYAVNHRPEQEPDRSITIDGFILGYLPEGFKVHHGCQVEVVYRYPETLERVLDALRIRDQMALFTLGGMGFEDCWATMMSREYSGTGRGDRVSVEVHSRGFNFTLVMVPATTEGHDHD